MNVLSIGQGRPAPAGIAQYTSGSGRVNCLGPISSVQIRGQPLLSVLFPAQPRPYRNRSIENSQLPGLRLHWRCHYGSIWQGLSKIRPQRHASKKERHTAVRQRRQGRQGDEPEAGDCHWPVRGAKERRKGSSKIEVRAGRPHLRRRVQDDPYQQTRAGMARCIALTSKAILVSIRERRVYSVCI